ncbi:MAG: hypothetical protein BTN85_0419 [Candidatus Methanohalarchaeum thermophilum]|uniref:Uncharacterized protein n=1 Tax=Methanohalarchaeum thermophilum TaxID=1903181 RepID=A0A1Q6DUF2_METT1|nr:MAG: hypothetical protein BTN85_0419 [Candidatus Methanohalarchaeum thermophilum]
MKVGGEGGRGQLLHVAGRGWFPGLYRVGVTPPRGGVPVRVCKTPNLASFPTSAVSEKEKGAERAALQ